MKKKHKDLKWTYDETDHVWYAGDYAVFATSDDEDEEYYVAAYKGDCIAIKLGPDKAQTWAQIHADLVADGADPKDIQI